MRGGRLQRPEERHNLRAAGATAHQLRLRRSLGTPDIPDRVAAILRSIIHLFVAAA